MRDLKTYNFKITFTCFTFFFNATTRTFQIAHVARVVFLLAGAGLESAWPIVGTQ